MPDILVKFYNDQCQITHYKNKCNIITDSPKELGGHGLSFCSTDLILAALGSCIMNSIKNTLIRDGFTPEETEIELEKKLSYTLNKITAIDIKLINPKVFSEKTRKKLLNCIKVCPVKNSLDSEIKLNISFINI